MPFKRPSEVVSQVWRMFEGREREGRTPRKYVIRDLEPKEKDICIKTTMASFLRDEPLCATLDILNDESSVNTILSNWSGFIDEEVTLTCVDDQGSAAGYAICQVLCRDDCDDVDIELIKGDQWKKLLKTLIEIDRTCDIFTHYGVERYISVNVLSVDAKHRGQNIGAELFKATEDLARAVKIPIVAFACTAESSQKLAQKCGYTLLSEFPYKNMLEHGIDLSNCCTEVAKVYGKRISS